MNRVIFALIALIIICGVSIYAYTQNFWRDHNYVSELYIDNPRYALRHLTWWELNRHRDQVELLLNDTTWRQSIIMTISRDFEEPGKENRCTQKDTYERNCDYALMRLLFHPKVISEFQQYDYTVDDFKTKSQKKGYIEKWRILSIRYDPSRLSERVPELQTQCDEYYAIPDSLFSKIRDCYFENVRQTH